jgi:hypothetical protein
MAPRRSTRKKLQSSFGVIIEHEACNMGGNAARIEIKRMGSGLRMVSAVRLFATNVSSGSIPDHWSLKVGINGAREKEGADHRVNVEAERQPAVNGAEFWRADS